MHTPKRLFFFLTPFLGLLAIASYFIYHTLNHFDIFHHPYANNLFILVAIFAPLILITTMLIGSKRYSIVNASIYAFSSMWLVMLSYLSIMAVFLWIMHAVLGFFNLAQPMFAIWICSMISIYGIIFLGIDRAAHPKIKEVEIVSPALAPLWRGKKIVLVSDIHIGMVRRDNFVKKVVGKINSVRPDMILIAGDLIDGPRFPYEKFLAPLSHLNAPLGIYYTPGNHEYYNNEQERFFAAIPKNITLLVDETRGVNGTDIVGIDFASETLPETEKRVVRAHPASTRPTIALFHDPKNIHAIIKHEIDLVVSGHTHGGQFFPMTLLVKALHKQFTKGLNYVGKTASFVTVGAGTAMSPVRIGTTPEIVVIHIV